MTDKQTITTTEPNRADYMRWAVDHREELSKLSREAGASGSFIRVINTPHSQRHSVLMTLYRHHRTGENTYSEPTLENIKSAKRNAGGLFRHLWNGDLWLAWRNADPNNKDIMRECLDKFEVEAAAPDYMDVDW